MDNRLDATARREYSRNAFAGNARRFAGTRISARVFEPRVAFYKSLRMPCTATDNVAKSACGSARMSFIESTV